ncbi:shikimate dehydrogenase [Aliiruegeria sabulilitoris]|uniref:shikimate dehydrogenase n=1 Tax=Aliiruegeria sabulilitoris TaxID=1510458 RepID=UPI0008373C5D|nr:shikimate dehydrogenase [Aliiruegeria sabulilitoris]NDR55486.1 shikimate dehydrogenase [Pseudoruegeria sp. M32A2M]
MKQGDPEKVGDFDVLVGLIGRGIKQSRTPSMHMAEARAQGGRCDYHLMDMDDEELGSVSLEAVLEKVEADGFAGVNVTYPYKIKVMALLDELSANASAVGAVNTVIFRDGRRTGHNTDLWGFAESFRRGLRDVKRDHALLIGAGGAGVAVAHGLADCCKVGRLSIHDVDPARAEALAEHVSKRWGTQVNPVSDLAALVSEDRPDGVVNATPVGMDKLPGSAFPTELLKPEMWVADVVYFPLETELLKAAKARGCRVLSGAGMAVFQAVRAFELFTGRPADPERMRATFDAFVQKPKEMAGP